MNIVLVSVVIDDFCLFSIAVVVIGMAVVSLVVILWWGINAEFVSNTKESLYKYRVIVF